MSGTWGQPGIYQIRHVASGRLYIGSAANIGNRWSKHRFDLRHGIHQNPHLQNAWNRYGEAAFVFEVLECVTDVALLLAAEQRYFAELQPAFNILRQAGRPVGITISAEHRAKISAFHKGRKRSPETRARISAAQKGRLLAPEHRAKISASQKGRPKPEGMGAKVGAFHKGRKRSPETVERMRAARQASTWQWSDADRQRMSEQRKGKSLHPNTRAAISEHNRVRVLSPETRALMAQKRQEWWVQRRQAEPSQE